MRHKVTPRTLELARELHEAAAQTEPYLAFASPAARSELRALRATWPSREDLRGPTLELSDTELETMLAKVHRFGAILRHAARASSAGPIGIGRARGGGVSAFTASPQHAAA